MTWPHVQPDMTSSKCMSAAGVIVLLPALQAFAASSFYVLVSAAETAATLRRHRDVGPLQDMSRRTIAVQGWRSAAAPPKQHCRQRSSCLPVLVREGAACMTAAAGQGDCLPGAAQGADCVHKVQTWPEKGGSKGGHAEQVRDAQRGGVVVKPGRTGVHVRRLQAHERGWTHGMPSTGGAVRLPRQQEACSSAQGLSTVRCWLTAAMGPALSGRSQRVGWQCPGKSPVQSDKSFAPHQADRKTGQRACLRPARVWRAHDQRRGRAAVPGSEGRPAARAGGCR